MKHFTLDDIENDSADAPPVPGRAARADRSRLNWSGRYNAGDIILAKPGRPLKVMISTAQSSGAGGNVLHGTLGPKRQPIKVK